MTVRFPTTELAAVMDDSADEATREATPTGDPPVDGSSAEATPSVRAGNCDD
ncbi:hypothetical protein RYH80_10180 [Halobaculum sp. MBLA0147]|uniref:hypothetical protein n=1 Tax=Halobaculum sp. MBLA0147 TaxID=3079934 RepID=UPI003524A3DC